MSIEKVRVEFVQEIETGLAQKAYAIDQLYGVEKIKAKYKHLDELNIFAEMLNSRINTLLDKHNIEFQNDEEFNKFNAFIKPTFEHLYRMFTAVGYEKPE